MRNRLVIFIDRVAPKNKLQVETIHKLGFNASFFVSQYNEASGDYFTDEDTHEKLAPGFLDRFKQVFNFISKNRKTIHHAEIYPAGRFSSVYLVICRFLFKIKCICVERGDIQYYVRNESPRLERFSMWFCYKFADVVWYRELYMKEILEKMNIRKLFFLHNCVDINIAPAKSSKDIDFLWVNRVIAERKHEWFINILKTPAFSATNNYLVGMTNFTLFKEEQEFVLKNKSENLTIVDFMNDPVSYYQRAKFFVLPADVVFVNNSLIEAMNYGVVPLISDVSGASLIVDDNKNGFLVRHTKEDFEAAMNKAMYLSAEEYNVLSAAAKQKILADFSATKYFEGIEKLYNSF